MGTVVRVSFLKDTIEIVQSFFRGQKKARRNYQDPPSQNACWVLGNHKLPSYAKCADCCAACIINRSIQPFMRHGSR